MNRKKLKKIIFVAGGVFIIIFIIMLLFDKSMQIGYVGNEGKNKMNGKFQYLDGTKEKKIKCKEGQTVTISYKLAAKKGKLELKVVDKKGSVVEKREDEEGKISFNVKNTQKYKLLIQAEKAKGNFDLRWKIE